jgi:EpsD family peptidyl-prolyl cis-trans isomerase
MNLVSTRPERQAPTRIAALTLAIAGALVLTACGGHGENKASQTAAKVNKEEITVHQINFLLQQQRGLKPEQTDAASRQILERLIDQELAVQKADDLKLDRDPRVVQQMEAAKREILARAYVEKVGEGATKPTSDEVQKFYDEKPALFKERRIYNIQEIAIEAKPEQVADLRSHLEGSKNVNEFIDYLRSAGYRFGGNQAVRAAEQLPLQGLDAFARMHDGQAVLTPTPTGAQVIVLAGSTSQPVDLERARPAIEQYLLSERKRELVNKEVKDLRAAAKIEYVGKFADAAARPASAASAAAAPSSVSATASVPAASSGALDASTISKGMGVK